MYLTVLSKCFLNTNRLGAVTTTLGSLFQRVTTFSFQLILQKNCVRFYIEVILTRHC